MTTRLPRVDTDVPYRLATIEDDGWQLESGVARHAAHPDSFWIPSAEEREGLAPGAVAQLIFSIQTEDEFGTLEQSVERMWVYVAGRVGDFYVGRLQSRPECTDDIGPGLEVVFRPEHVIDIAGSPPPDWEPV